MTKLAILALEGIIDFVITAGSSLTGYMVASSGLVMPSKAAVIVAVISGLVGAANQMRGRLKDLPVVGLVVVLAGTLALTGCARTLGYAGQHPGYVKCVGKGAITGTGTLAIGSGIGGAGTNSFTIQADCGDGFAFEQGIASGLAPKISPAPTPAPGQ